MSKAHQSESAFTASLKDRLRTATTTSQTMHMTPPPSGASKSLEDLLRDDTADEPLAAPAAAPQPATMMNIPAVTTDESNVVRKIALQDIVDSPYQPRKRYDETRIQLLGETLKARGQDEAIVVRRLPSGKYELISGHRRTRAARLIGWSDIDARVRPLSDREAELATLTSNESNEELSTYERAKAYQEALDRGFASDQKGIASLFGCSQGRVSQCLSLLQFPTPILDLLEKYPGLLKTRHARVVKDVLAKYPHAVDTIAASVEVLIDKPDMDVDELQAVLVKPFEKKRVRTKPPEPRMITDKNGVSAFKVQIREREIVIKVEEGVDVDLASRRAMGALRDFAGSLELPKKKSV
ncbi:ParB/RepB/Spo0J family partition protein [Massilia putida]|uniref:ParB/RepB/Spo0J family partition protein n=1 Tax=Massilia putida TaxID=1141883 RepID=UPI000951B1A1|nr:ParB/RepB/Spo0J family partition protein [Massilia putida]